MSKTRTLTGLAAGAVSAAVAVVGLGAGVAAASPQTPLFPEVVTQECMTGQGLSTCTVTMLNRADSRTVIDLGIPKMLGDWFVAEPTFAEADGNPKWDGCVVFGYYEIDNAVRFRWVPKDSPTFRCA